MMTVFFSSSLHQFSAQSPKPDRIILEIIFVLPRRIWICNTSKILKFSWKSRIPPSEEKKYGINCIYGQSCLLHFANPVQCFLAQFHFFVVVMMVNICANRSSHQAWKLGHWPAVLRIRII